METPDLVKILAQATEPKGTSEPNLNDFAKVVNTVTPNNDDFEPAPEEPAVKAKLNLDQFAENPTNDNLTKKGREKLSSEEYRRMAKNSLGLAEGFNIFVMPMLYQKSLFTKEEMPLIKELDSRQKLSGTKEVEYTEDELKLLQKIEAYEGAKEALPFQETEIERLVETLGGLFEKYDWRVTKETEAIGVILMAFAPRFMPLFNKLTVI